MEMEDWTVLTDCPFDTELEARKLLTTFKIQMQSHFGARPHSIKKHLRFKVSEINSKFYVLYKLP